VAVLAEALLRTLLIGVVWPQFSGWLGGVPLLDPTAATVIEVLGAVALLVTWLGRDRRWRRRSLLVALASAASTGVVAAVLRLTGTVTDPYPATFAIWVAVAFAAMAGLPLVLRSAGNGWAGHGRRVTASMAVPLTATGAFLIINYEYGIWPYARDVFAHVHTVSPEALALLTAPQRYAGVPRGPVIQPPHVIVVGIDPPGTRSHFRHRPGVVVLPPAYFGPQGAHLPVLVMLVGTPGTPINWLRAGHAQAVADAYASAHHGIAPVLVVIDHNGSATADSECVDGPQGAAETYLTLDVPAFLTGELHLVHDADRWGVAGFSEGGTCALDLVLRHPDVYRHLVDLAGDPRPNLGNAGDTLRKLYGGSRAAQQAHDPVWLLATGQYSGVTAWFAAGAGDRARVRTSRRLAVASTGAGILTHEFVGIGGHNWQFAADAFARILAPLCDEMACLPAGSK
jgi:S-formylglutathione hydrolase FrmB